MTGVGDAIEKRRAVRALLPEPVGDDVVRELAAAARLSPSAENKQPWRLVFVRSDETVRTLRDRAAFPDFNEWVFRGSMFVAICGREQDDDSVTVVHRSYSSHGEQTVTSDRPLFLFDLGIATGFMMLRATELGWIAHPIAGYDEPITKDVLGIPEDDDLVAMLIVGKRSTSEQDIDSLPPDLQADERQRPAREELSAFAFGDRFGRPIPE